ncbi:MAG: universal stress protein [Rhodoferax sp.]|jgi:nucleotide-binding universal stress UspA family protein|nr:universal stress protein [Rhodoferax sp.]
MHSIRQIFAATDLSPLSLHAVDRGFLIARTTAARYTLLHAMGLDALGPLRNLIGTKADKVTHTALAQQRAALEAIAGDAARNKGITCRIQVEEGMATTVVPALAAAGHADLVVVGARGESALKRLLIGSTASRLLRKSSCPVLLVKKPAKGPYLRALLPVDFSPVSEAAIRLMREIAPHAQIVLLHVFDVPFEGMLQYAGVSAVEVRRYRAEARERALRELHALARRAGLQRTDYALAVEHGQTVHHILEHESRTRCNLIIMGKHGTHVTEELLLGSVTKRVLGRCRADVLVVTDKRATGAPPA